jgi:hypothetical protein
MNSVLNKVLVMGKAKTGTTIISKTIANSLDDCEYQMEPKDPELLICESALNKNSVTKVIHEHWNKKPRMRSAILFDEINRPYTHKINIIRDPRDEVISRLLYVIYPWLERHGGINNNHAKVSEWLALIEQKEKDPSSLSLCDLVTHINRIFDMYFEGNYKTISMYTRFIGNHAKQVFIIKYEDFMMNNLDELEEYLGFTLTKRRDVGDLSRTVRTKSYDNWKRFFTEQDVGYFKKHYGNDILNMGYENWDLEPVDELDAGSHSNYIRRLTGIK